MELAKAIATLLVAVLTLNNFNLQELHKTKSCTIETTHLPSSCDIFINHFEIKLRDRFCHVVHNHGKSM